MKFYKRETIIPSSQGIISRGLNQSLDLSGVTAGYTFTLQSTRSFHYLELLLFQPQSIPDLPTVGHSISPPVLSLSMTIEHSFIGTLIICFNAHFSSDLISLKTKMLFVCILSARIMTGSLFVKQPLSGSHEMMTRGEWGARMQNHLSTSPVSVPAV